jgi:hypothetical protein
MASSKPATTWTDADPRAYVAAVEHPVRRRDAETLLDLMARATGQEPRLFGDSMVGFGEYHYEYASGHSGDAPAAAFAPRKAHTVVYLNDGVAAHAEALARLGPHKASVGCLYLTDLAMVNLGVLEQVVRDSYATLTAGTFGQRARGAGA